MGVDFGPYLALVVQHVRSNWYSLLPPSVYPPIQKPGKVSIQFVILKDGHVSGMELHKSSGDVALDRAAWASITASSPFHPLPEEFKGPTLGLRFYYFYNIDPADRTIDNADKTIPSKAPAPPTSWVAVGTTRQFRLPEGFSSKVTWTVEGTKCESDYCGSISSSGLYKAPAKLPEKTAIAVVAKTNDDPKKTARRSVTVVPNTVTVPLSDVDTLIEQK
jgi:TonB family protein